MADIFKNGILYMDSLNDSDIFNDILKEQERKAKLKEERNEEEEFNKKAEETEKEIIEAFKEIQEKIQKNPNTVIFDENGNLYASNGYGVNITKNGDEIAFNVLMPD